MERATLRAGMAKTLGGTGMPQREYSRTSNPRGYGPLLAAASSVS
jgi:hypothetical protein